MRNFNRFITQALASRWYWPAVIAWAICLLLAVLGALDL